MAILTSHALAELIAGGESETVEFKKGVPPSSIIAQTLSAFANTRGGVLILGVSHGARIVGLQPTEVPHAKTLLRRVAESLLPHPIDVESVELNGKHLVYAAVDPAARHVRPIMTAGGDVFERRGVNLHKLSPGEEVEAITPDAR